MRSRARQQGVLEIDHSSSPGTGRVPEGKKMAWKTRTCKHCQKPVPENPERIRERGYCPKCDHFICDNCVIIRAADGGKCRDMSRMFDKMQEQAFRALAAIGRG